MGVDCYVVQVYKARCVPFNEVVAIKVLDLDSGDVNQLVRCWRGNTGSCALHASSHSHMPLHCPRLGRRRADGTHTRARACSGI
jgi:hypothetical protein